MMKNLNRITLILVTGFMAVVMQSCSKTDPNTVPAGGGNNDHKVNIQATQFDPVNLTMLPSAKLTWTNTDTQPHSIVADDGISFNSGSLSTGATFSFTPTAIGAYPYHCGIHPAVQGNIYVVSR